MTPVGHYAASAVIGMLAMKVTGSPVIGGIVAFGLHVPIDLAFNEFYQWDDGMGKRLLFAFFMIPAVIILGCLTGLADNWKAILIFGLLGCLPDVIDTALFMLVKKHFLHWDTSAIMMSFFTTILVESAFTILALASVEIFRL